MVYASCPAVAWQVRTMAMYSKRFDWNAPPHPLGKAVERQLARGHAIIDLTDANPTRAGFDYGVGSISMEPGSADALGYAPAPRGLPAAREAVSRHYAAAGHTVCPDSVLLTTSTSEAYGLLFKLLADPGDEILIPRPGYPLLSHLAGFEGVACHSYPLRYDETSGWTVDLEILSALVTARTRAVVVVNPNNPTGNYVKAEALAAMDDLCQRHGLALIVDEVFLDYPTGSRVHAESSVVNRTRALTFVLSGFSKLLGLPQMKLGWIVAGGAPEQALAAISHLETLMDFYLTVGTPVQHAVPRLLDQGQAIRRQINQRIMDNEGWLKARLADTGNMTLLAREGGWYAVFSIDDAVSDDERALTLIARERTLIHPGTFYQFHREGFVVVSLLLPTERFVEGIRRLIRQFAQPAA